MSGRGDRLLAHLREARARLREVYASVPEARRNTPAPDGGWSAAQIVGHLQKIEQGLVAALRRRLRAAMAAGSLGPARADAPTWPRLADPTVDRSRRIEAPATFRAAADVDATAAWQALEGTRAALEQLVRDAASFDTDPIRFDHATLGELTFEEWVAFVGYHELRHAAQMVDSGNR